MNKANKWLIKTARVMKPILIKILPVGFLRKAKRTIVSNSLKKLWKEGKEPYEANRYPKGINLIGNIKAETGLGQSCRLLASILDNTEYPINIYQYSQLGIQKESDTAYDNRINSELIYDINVIHINPHEMAVAYLDIDKSAWDYRYNIAYWLWELEDFPDEWTSCFNYLDEIWAPSEFICESIRKKTDKPVKCIHYHITAEITKEYARSDFNLPEDKFLYLMMYDHGSCVERKNPMGVIKAFKKAFPKEETKVGLVIKINNASNEDDEIIQDLCREYTNIYLIKETLEKSAVNSLIKCADAVVSLHRAEGFGLVMAEAMLLGTPVIATNWSANTEFMNSDTACMIDYEIATLKKDISLYKAGSRWASPDINQAAMYMRKLHEDKTYYTEISQKAQQYIQKELSLKNAALKSEDRIKEIYYTLENRDYDKEI
ncbi:MAG: glycosyltransferase [Firmicutes bacterium]|nr:glycosyltransferase [Bacillota bacterium]